ncbi:MAG: GGDEF domain-containing protein, partial [Lachnospiraceae bacterium]|nr:GGDEF domain-containing protein [Lachnospiraceae bacterium]
HRIESIELSTFFSMRMSADFSHVSDIDTGMDKLEEYVKNLDDCREFYLCLFSDWDAVAQPILELTDTQEDIVTSDDTITLQFALRDGKRLPECTFSKTTLLPEYLSKDSDAAYIISPLYFEERAFGYLVMAYDKNHINYSFEQVQWIMNITGLLQNICEAKGSRLMQSKLLDLYMRDSLTGLYNRHGYEQKAEALLATSQPGQSITLFLFDMDCLKLINDQHGHTEGDFALRVIGQAINNSASPDMICSRFGGDEFMVLSNRATADEADRFLEKVNSFLNNYTCLTNKPYELSVSGGYASEAYSKEMTLESLQELLKVADAHMYEQKKAKKKARL